MGKTEEMTNKFPEHKLKEGLNVLSLFDGMGCVWEVLESLKIKVTNAYSSEIDKFANIANHNAHPYVIPLGDVRGVYAKDLPPIDFVCGGSPCQGFSFAGKQLKFDDPRSALFWEYVRILEEIKKVNPNVIFFLENVQMDKRSELVISQALGIEPVFINSALVCAQNRERNYWTNIGTVQSGFFGDIVQGIQQPKDRGIFLRDILQPIEEVDQKYFLSEKAMQRFFRRHDSGFSLPRIMPEKTGTLTSRSNNGQLQMDSGLTLVPIDFVKCDKDGIPKPNQEKAACLTGGGHSGGNHSDMDVICCAIRGRYNKDNKVEQQLEPNTKGKTNGLTTVQKDNIVAIIQQGRGYNAGGEFIYKSPPITANSWEHNHTLTQDFIFRRLTPIECCRLQGVSDNFFLRLDGKQVVSDSQIYKMLGNGWQLDTIQYIIKHAII